ncbi:hypothetical protein, partial [Salmonella enterica]|uniref:hypothetical protein n=1 Tax=Salmonella enterica TaxID=28901 RepID=UPI003FA7D575
YGLWQSGRGGQYVLRTGRIVETGWRALVKAIRNPLDLPVQWRMQGTAVMLGVLFSVLLLCGIAPGAMAGLVQATGGWRLWAIGGGAIGLTASI